MLLKNIKYVEFFKGGDTFFTLKNDILIITFENRVFLTVTGELAESIKQDNLLNKKELKRLKKTDLMISIDKTLFTEEEIKIITNNK